MSSLAHKYGFDEDSAVITMLAFWLQSVIGFLGVSLSIKLIGADAYPVVSGVLGGPLGYIAQHLSDKVIASRYGGVLIPNHATSFQLDAVRGTMFMVMLVPACIGLAIAIPPLMQWLTPFTSVFGIDFTVILAVLAVGSIVGIIITRFMRKRRA